MPEPGTARYGIQVDATWQDGDAFIAITGDIGRHVRYIPASSSTEAELYAVHWAFTELRDLARREGRTRPMTVQTDALPLLTAGKPFGSRAARTMWLELQSWLKRHPEWKLQWVTRDVVAPAHRLARREARRWKNGGQP